MKLDDRWLVGGVVGIVAGVVALVLWPEAAPVQPADPPHPSTEPADPCEARPHLLHATPLEGPYASAGALCDAWAGGECERIEPAPGDSFLPFEDLYFIRRAVAEEELDDKVAVGLAVELGGLWWLRPAMSERRETLVRHERVARPRALGPPMLEIDAVWERRFYHSPGDPDGAVQVLERRATYLCSKGAGERPSCIYAPWRWSRETRRPGEEPSDIAVSELTQTFCDNGRLLIEGTTERLSGDNEALVERLLGLDEPVFP